MAKKSNSPKRPKSSRRARRGVTRRVSAALTRFLRKQNPAKMRGVKHVRVRKLKGGGISIIPVKD